ncbi:MAG: nucleotidyl transferase AbiEii/AbiGii toxin family protein, partial [Dehalococcoidia bacterium]
MRYATSAAFRQALDDRLKTEAAKTGLGIARLRKRVAFELFLHRLVAVAPDRWVLKGALALDFRFHATTRSTRDMDLGRADDEEAAVEDFAAAQELALDDFFTFAARRTYAFDDADDFRAIRFHVTAELAGRVFDQFVVDVGFADSISWTPDAIETSDLLSFAGIERIRVPALPLPQHIAEKMHAYTRKYGASGRESTRPKDLVDVLLISRSERLDAFDLRNAIEVTFGKREQQLLPASLPPPPSSWK